MSAASEEEIDGCQFHCWYPKFGGRNTIKSRIIHLSKDFVNYLSEDGLILPDSSAYYYNQDNLSDDEDLREVEGGDVCFPQYDFSAIEAEVNEALQEFGGEVFIKLNWSCPSDAVWINADGLKCRSLSDIYVLLKSSSRISFDLEQMYDSCPNRKVSNFKKSSASDGHHKGRKQLGKCSPKEPVLIIRKWASLHKSMEFRVFVYRKRVVGICQRDCTTYYSFLPGKVDELQSLILLFFRNVISPVFEMDKYTVDLYIDRKNRAWIIDFNVFGEPTCPLLFEWNDFLLDTAVTEAETAVQTTSNCFNTSGGASTVVTPPPVGGLVGCDKGNGVEMTASFSPCLPNPPGINTGTLADELVMTSPTPSSASASSSSAFVRAPSSGGSAGGAEGSLAEQLGVVEFRVVESEDEVLQSTAGRHRGPVDVHLAPDFSSFMELCRTQQQSVDGGDDNDDKV